jgi:hypothetical protein
MKRAVLLIVTGVLLAAAVWALVENWPSHGTGYKYQGKTVRQWLEEVWTTNQTVAMAAFHEMGTNAFPGLFSRRQRRSFHFDFAR